MYDLLLKNGRVIDPYNNLDKIADIAISNGLIEKVQEHIDEKALHVIDVSGCHVTPGLIDFHTHIYPLAEIGVLGEATYFPSGVTTAVDAGSSGAGTFEGHRGALNSTKLTVKSFLNISSGGLATGSYLENLNPKQFNRDKIKKLFRKYSHELIGLKVRQGAEIVGELGLEPLRETIKLAEELGVRVMVHCSNPPSAMAELVDLLRPGDILSHAYQSKASTILDQEGIIIPEVRNAKERGVIFDVAHANVHFSHQVASKAFEQGLLPDTISTDLTVRSLYKRPAVMTMLHVMSKFIAMGLTLDQVIRATTQRPAALLGLEQELGSLSAGTAADIAVLRLLDSETEFGDCDGDIIYGSQQFRAMITVKEGELVFRDVEI
ncbi:amidohydrolase family protein [Acidaminobacter hydrogenoformans]|uniref:Predicted amidohydrolase n=1 Tax=Acidaminobacter hydrogenoformans DSM 2784 TaxID=1120920 RepID=A0A1G5S223_9FIRM|nr:amidohydrolase family protein [Acidaminobacter hydrogenoformans]SCZ80187.1 Predicted amidohydrolase [Acidaminobacter hydrogenoformans DSM 2784]